MDDKMITNLPQQIAAQEEEKKEWTISVETKLYNSTLLFAKIHSANHIFLVK